MSLAVERLVNLALFLANAQGTVTATDIREGVTGYPAEADDTAFKRMLERDKDVLRSSGLVIEADDLGNYRLDRAASYLAPLNLSAEEAAAVRAAGWAVLEDPAFPFAPDLRLALAKIADEMDAPDIRITAVLADEEPDRQGALVAELASAAARCKRASFGYTNSLGTAGAHEIEPYGLFLHDGRWYLVGRDTARDEVRTYAVGRIDELVVNAAAPKTADFARPEGFDVSSFIRLPFQYGPPDDHFVARIRFDTQSAWRAERIAAGHGSLESDAEGVVWEVGASSIDRLLRFVIENGPGLCLESPPQACAAYVAGLARVEAIHA